MCPLRRNAVATLALIVASSSFTVEAATRSAHPEPSAYIIIAQSQGFVRWRGAERNEPRSQGHLMFLRLAHFNLDWVPLRSKSDLLLIDGLNFGPDVQRAVMEAQMRFASVIIPDALLEPVQGDALNIMRLNSNVNLPADTSVWRIKVAAMQMLSLIRVESDTRAGLNGDTLTLQFTSAPEGSPVVSSLTQKFGPHPDSRGECRLLFE